MGQIADDIVAGLCCSECGTYFAREHGHPALCHDCWKSWTAAQLERAGLRRAYIPEVGDDRRRKERVK